MSDVVYYNLGTIARIITHAHRTKIYTEDRIWQFIQEGSIRAERIPDGIRGGGKRPYWVKETDLIAFLDAKGYDTEKMFNR